MSPWVSVNHTANDVYFETSTTTTTLVPSFMQEQRGEGREEMGRGLAVHGYDDRQNTISSGQDGRMQKRGNKLESPWILLDDMKGAYSFKDALCVRCIFLLFFCGEGRHVNK